MTSEEILREMRKGATAYHNGAEVIYMPRYKFDRQPWAHWDGREWEHYPASGVQVVHGG